MMNNLYAKFKCLVSFPKFQWVRDVDYDLPKWPSGRSTRPPCAVERDALSGRGSLLSPGASAYQRIISNNSYAHDEQAVNTGQVRGFKGVLYKL